MFLAGRLCLAPVLHQGYPVLPARTESRLVTGHVSAAELVRVHRDAAPSPQHEPGMDGQTDTQKQDGADLQPFSGLAVGASGRKRGVVAPRGFSGVLPCKSNLEVLCPCTWVCREDIQSPVLFAPGGAAARSARLFGRERHPSWQVIQPAQQLYAMCTTL